MILPGIGQSIPGSQSVVLAVLTGWVLRAPDQLERVRIPDDPAGHLANDPGQSINGFGSTYW